MTKFSDDLGALIAAVQDALIRQPPLGSVGPEWVRVDDALRAALGAFVKDGTDHRLPDDFVPCGCTRVHPQQCPFRGGIDNLPLGVYCAALGPTAYCAAFGLTEDRLAEEGMRRIVQIAAAFDAGDGCGGQSSYQPAVGLYALCNDGTLWTHVRGEWIDLPAIPQPGERTNHAYSGSDREQHVCDALNYVADMTYCGADGDWHFKRDYDPQLVLDTLAAFPAEGK